MIKSEAELYVEAALPIALNALMKEKRREVRLEIELFIYENILKKTDNEKDNQKLFSALSQLYPISTNRFSLKGDGLAFFCHNTAWLAHITPMFNMIKMDAGRSISPARIKIFTLGKDQDFIQKFRSLGVETIKINSLSEIEMNCRQQRIGNLVWQSVPLYLPYIASQIKGISWWALKFHSNIAGLKKYVTNSDIDGNLHFNGRTWQKFIPPTLIENNLAVPSNWKRRKKLFGAFCREELINNADYWRHVSLIIDKFDMSFYYTGRTEIHKKYVDLFKINPKKVKFMGWLEKPHQRMLDMNFILDGNHKGHGMMVSEAIAGGIPIIWPKYRKDRAHSRIEKIYNEAASSYTHLPAPDFYKSRFDSESSLLQTINENCLKENDNQKLANFQKELTSYRTEGDFRAFLSILEST